MGMLSRIRQRWSVGTLKVLELQEIASSRAGLLVALSKFIRVASQSFILGLGAYLVIEHEISPGLMIAGSILLGRALAPVDFIVSSWKGFVIARDQYQRLNEILLRIPEEQEQMPLPNPQGKIQLDNAMVTLASSKTPIIKGVNLTIEKGDIVGIIGASGAGKSTLARAIIGVLPTSHGTIRLDGAEVFKWDREHLGNFIGYLPQDIELFEGSISENIARFGNIDSEKVIAAAKMADVHELILGFSEGYDTIISANGANLSGGQRQRIGLARALYGDPVLVVLDEPNSNLDEQGEAALEKALGQLKQKQSTVIIITHRNNVLAKVDKLLILQLGLLVAYGPRDKVITQLKQHQNSTSMPPATQTLQY